MLDMKTWYQSRTIWGALIAILASTLQMAGIHLADADQTQLADSALALSGAIGGLIAVYGRIRADKKLG